MSNAYVTKRGASTSIAGFGSTTSSASSAELPVTVGRTHARPSARAKDVEGAVYSYIQAVRTLGRTRINTADIATALRLPLKEVDRAVARLGSKGVKIVE